MLPVAHILPVAVAMVPKAGLTFLCWRICWYQFIHYLPFHRTWFPQPSLLSFPQKSSCKDRFSSDLEMAVTCLATATPPFALRFTLEKATPFAGEALPIVVGLLPSGQKVII